MNTDSKNTLMFCGIKKYICMIYNVYILYLICILYNIHNSAYIIYNA